MPLLSKILMVAIEPGFSEPYDVRPDKPASWLFKKKLSV